MRKQRAFASLHEDEINQIAEWLRTTKYDEVRVRIARPRPEGFGLELKSTRPLETLWANLNTVDKINRKLEQGEKLSVSEFRCINAGEDPDVSEKVHDAIMDTTYELATSGDNTPTQLLALQRLADFPERAELREHKRQLELRKEQRDISLHAHKMEMDLHRKETTDKRLALSEKAHELRRDELTWKQSKTPNPTRNHNLNPPREDALGRLARNLDDVERRVCAQFNLPYNGPSPTESSPETPSPEPLGSLECGGSTPLSTASESPVAPEPITNEPHSGAASPQPSTPNTQPPSNPQPGTSNVPPIPPTVSSFPSLPSVENDSPSPVEIPQKTKSHAIRRWRAHIRRPAGTPEPDGSWRDECPCGNQAPCAEHPDLKTRVRSYRPQLKDYIEGLQEFNVPYYKPTAEEIGCTQEELDKSCDPFAYNPRMKDPPDPRFAPDWLRPTQS